MIASAGCLQQVSVAGLPSVWLQGQALCVCCPIAVCCSLQREEQGYCLTVCQARHSIRGCPGLLTVHAFFLCGLTCICEVEATRVSGFLLSHCSEQLLDLDVAAISVWHGGHHRNHPRVRCTQLAGPASS